VPTTSAAYSSTSVGDWREKKIVANAGLNLGTALQFGVTTGPTDFAGTGSPEGVVTASVGSTWRQTDGTTGKAAWYKFSGSGNTGWGLLGQGYLSVAEGDGTLALSISQAANTVIELTGAMTGAHSVTLPAIYGMRLIKNSTTGGHEVNVYGPAVSAFVRVSPGETKVVFCDASNCYPVNDDVIFGSNIPEGTISAQPGKRYGQTDGAGDTWVKVAGTGDDNSGWNVQPTLGPCINIVMPDATRNLTTDEARNGVIRFSDGGLTGNHVVTVPANTPTGRPFLIFNETAFILAIQKSGGGTAYNLAANSSAMVVLDDLTAMRKVG